MLLLSFPLLGVVVVIVVVAVVSIGDTRVVFAAGIADVVVTSTV